MEKSMEFLQEMFPIDYNIIYDTYMSKNEDIDETISSLISMCNLETKFPPTYEEAMLHISTSTSNTNEESNSKRKDSRRNLGKKEWKPPIIGKLSDDFLRLPNEISNNSASIGFVCKSCSKLNVKNIKNESCSLTSRLECQSSQMSTTEIENMDSIIRKRMEDNVSQTRYATMRGMSDIDNIQYLDDERLALMLQNQEFLKIIQSDPEFQQALKEDHKAATSSIDERDIDDIWQEREESIIFNPQESGLDYGYEQSDIVDPDNFFEDQQLDSKNHDVTTMCKSMGKASRNRINSLAKRFFSIRRRKASKPYNTFLFNQVGDRNNKSHQNVDSWETESTQQLITSENDGDEWLNLTHNYPNSISSIRKSDSSTTLI